MPYMFEFSLFIATYVSYMDQIREKSPLKSWQSIML